MYYYYHYPYYNRQYPQYPQSEMIVAPFIQELLYPHLKGETPAPGALSLL